LAKGHARKKLKKRKEKTHIDVMYIIYVDVSTGELVHVLENFHTVLLV
jgi:hypothetical protein